MLCYLGRQEEITFIFFVLFVHHAMTWKALRWQEGEAPPEPGLSALPRIGRCPCELVDQSTEVFIEDRVKRQDDATSPGSGGASLTCEKRRDSKDRRTGTPFGNPCFLAAMPKTSWSTLLVPFSSSSSFRRTALTPRGNPGNRYRPMICRVC
jgi:hypothetical protein